MRPTLTLAFAAVLALGLLGTGTPPSADADDALREGGPVRLFTVAYRHELDRVETYETFEASVREPFETEIAPNLADDRPNYVSYPEDQGLMAYMIGVRGLHAREIMSGGGGSAESLASLAVTYAPQIAYYGAKYPGVDSPGQLLLLALTDTSVRAIVEVFSQLAADHGVWVSVSTNVADFERIDGPTAALLGDPEAGTDYAYEAVTKEVYNQNFVFAPDGELVAAHKKAYLVPIERERELGLGMTGILPAEFTVEELPFGRLGTVTSKDAWMVDVNDRLDQLKATLLVQPEAFSTWAVSGGDLWPPDKFQRSGWLMTQRHPALRVNVTPMLTGNFGDVTFDGQPLVAVEAPGGVAGLCLLGQEPEPGWAAVGRWSTYLEPAENLCGEARRSEFEEVGRAMTPGSGDDLENAYAEDVVWVDLDLSLPAPSETPVERGDFTAITPVPGDAAQLVPRLTATADGAALAFVDHRRGNQSVYVSTTTDGHDWSEAVLVSDKDVRDHDHFDNQWWPVIAGAGDRLVAAFLDFRVENWDVYRAISEDGGATWSSNERLDDADPDEGTLRERGHSAPVLAAAPNGDLVAVWSDLRWPWVKPQVRVARSTDGGASWSASVRVDGGPVEADDDVIAGRSRGEAAGSGQHAPAAVFTDDGTLVVAWQDGGDDVESIVVARSYNGGETFNSTTLAPGPAFRPSLATDGETVWAAWERRTADGGSVVEVARSTVAGATWQSPRLADPDPPAGVTQRHATVLAVDGREVVVFADDRTGKEQVLVASAGDGPQRLERISDTTDGGQARAPTAALLDAETLLVVWQDTRDGVEVLRGAIGSPAVVDTPPPAAPLPATGAGAAIVGSLLAAALSLRPRRRAWQRTADGA